MRWRFLLACVAAVTAGWLALQADEPAKTTGPTAAEVRARIALDEQILGQRFKEFEMSLLKLMQRLEKSNKQEDKDKAALLAKALDEAKAAGISAKFAQLVETINKKNFGNPTDLADVLEQSRQLGEKLQRIMRILDDDSKSLRLREERKSLEELLKKLEKVIHDQKVVQARTERGTSDPKQLANDQNQVTKDTEKIAQGLDKNGQGGEAKDNKGNAKDAGKTGEQKAGKGKDAGKTGEGSKAQSKDAGNKDPNNKDSKPGEAKASGDPKADPKNQGNQNAKDAKAGEAKDGKGGDAKSGSSKDSKSGAQSKSGDSKAGGQQGSEQKQAQAKEGGKDEKSGGIKEKAEAKGQDNKKESGPSKAGEPKAEAKSGPQKGGDPKSGEAKDSKSGSQSKSGDSKSGDSKSGDSKQGEAKSGQSSQGQSQSKSGQQGQQGPQPQQNPDPNQKQQQPKEGQPQQENGKKQIEDAKYPQEQAEKKIKDGDNKQAADKQQDALDKLEAAKKKLEQLLQQIREEELERLLAALQARCQKMLEMQINVLHGTEAVFKSVQSQPDKQPTRIDKQKSQDLADNPETGEKAIVAEADKAIQMLEAEGSAVAFPEVFKQVREDMAHVQRRLAIADTGKVTQDIERDIIDTLKEMIDALKKQQQDMDKKKQKQGDPKESKNQQPQDQKLLDQIAELKMIKSLQVRLNERTKLYAREYQGEQANEPRIRTEVRGLTDRQARIYEVTNRIAKGDNK